MAGRRRRLALLSSAPNIWRENLKAQLTWRRPWLDCGCSILLGVSSPVLRKSRKNCSMSRTPSRSGHLLQAHHCAWPIRWFRGALADAKAHADAGMGLYDEVGHARHRFLYLGHDPAVCALSIRSVLQWALGYPTQGLQSERDAIDLARRLQHVPSLAHALWFVCQAQIVRGDAAAVVRTASELLTLSEEHGLPQTYATALVHFGWAIAQTDDVSGGIQRLEEGLAKYNRLGVRTNLCLMICLLAETYFMARHTTKPWSRRT